MALLVILSLAKTRTRSILWLLMPWLFASPGHLYITTTIYYIIHNIKQLWIKYGSHSNKRNSKSWCYKWVNGGLLCNINLTRYKWGMVVNSLRPRKNGRSFADDTFKRIFLTENVWILIKIPLKFVPKGLINNNPALVQIMAWRRSGDKPLSEPMMVSLLMHICVTRPQWVNWEYFEAN